MLSFGKLLILGSESRKHLKDCRISPVALVPKGDDYRVIYDYSFELDGDMPDVSVNRATLRDDSPPVRYGNSFKRYLRTMWRMRGTFGEDEGS